jgi:hypothetical protein
MHNTKLASGMARRAMRPHDASDPFISNLAIFPPSTSSLPKTATKHYTLRDSIWISAYQYAKHHIRCS